jgi:general L-amino acid transport system permease protein
MFPMFLPEDFFMDKLVRVIIAITLFEAAYCAEVIRGGLQALPRGQYDAAKSLGLCSYNFLDNLLCNEQI